MNPLSKLMLQYTVWIAIMPFAALVAAVIGLYALDCTIPFWLAMTLGPAFVIVLWAASGAWFWIRSSQMIPAQAHSAKWFLGSSLLWAPLLTAALAYALYKLGLPLVLKLAGY